MVGSVKPLHDLHKTIWQPTILIHYQKSRAELGVHGSKFRYGVGVCPLENERGHIGDPDMAVPYRRVGHGPIPVFRSVGSQCSDWVRRTAVH